MNMTILAATEKQLSFIKSLASEILGSDDLANQFIVKLHEDGALQTRMLVSGVIDELIAKRNAKRAEALPRPGRVELDPGMYKTADGTIYKVQKAVHGSGHVYAKKLVPPAEFGGNAEFIYAPGALRGLMPEQKMTLEEAKAWGALYGTCVRCGRTLTDERSIADGIGPVCAGKI
jgi:hypothetical protein